MAGEPADEVFSALADPTRRSILRAARRPGGVGRAHGTPLGRPAGPPAGTAGEAPRPDATSAFRGHGFPRPKGEAIGPASGTHGLAPTGAEPIASGSGPH